MVVIKFDTSNASFGEGNLENEIVRILGEIAEQVQEGNKCRSIRDINGNRIGTFVIESNEIKGGY